MKSNKVPIDIASVEVEKGEVTLTPTLQTFKIGGNKHSSGGTPQLLPEGTKVFSDYLKAESDLVKQLVGKDKKMSFAEMASSYNTNEEISKLNNSKEDELGKKTAQIMLSKKLAQLESIFEAQEQSKEQTSKLGLSSIMQKLELGKEVMRNGGALEKYQNGKIVPSVMASVIPKDDKPIEFQQEGDKDLIYHYRPMFGDTNFVKQDLASKRLLNNPDVEAYQALAIGYDMKNKSYLKDSKSVALRRSTIENILKNNTAKNYGSKTENWNYIDVYDDKGNAIIKNGINQVTELPTGDFTFNERKNALGHNVPSYIDSHNAKNQPYYYELEVRGNELPSKNFNSFTNFQKDLENKIKPKLPEKLDIPSTISTNPTTSTEESKVPSSSSLDDVYKMAIFKDIADLSTLEVRPPSYNYKPQNIAYQRFLPMNTMAAERQFNIQKEKLENSNLPENVKQAYLNDMYAKVQDNISDVQMKNYQGDNQTDNQNVNVYNSITDQNRKEKIGYDDKFDELNARTLYNRDVEKSRLKDQLLTNVGKYKQQKLMLGLVNQLGNNYYFDGEKVQYLPGKGNINTQNPMEQYKQATIDKILQSLSNNPSESQVKAAEAQIKALELLGKNKTD